MIYTLHDLVNPSVLGNCH